MSAAAAAPDVAGTVFDEADSEAARSYAEALLNVAARDGQADAALDELEAIQAEVLGPHPRFLALLASPSVPAAEKDRLLEAMIGGRVQPTVVKFLRVLSRRGRLGLLGPITRRVRALWDHRQGRRPVTVRSAAPLDEAQQAALRDRLAGLVGGTPVLTLEVDPALIGGLVVQVGDDVYDASIRNRLRQLRRRIVETKSREILDRTDLVEP